MNTTTDCNRIEAKNQAYILGYEAFSHGGDTPRPPAGLVYTESWWHGWNAAAADDVAAFASNLGL